MNIGGGAAMDSLNALILLRKERPELLQGRPTTIVVLDVDEEGPVFGERALAALLTEGAPLHGLNVSFRFARYDWSELAP